VKAKPSCVAGVELAGPDSAHFIPSVEALYGRAVDDVLRGALPYSVIVRNESAAAIALFGVRFDMTGANGKKYSVIHYADSLRHPEKADLVPGAARFVCAEPLYSDLVLRQSRDIDERSRMNLENLRKALQVRASLDCVAFDNGHFAGPDTNGAFDRLARERHAESELVRKISRRSPDDVEAALLHAMEIPDCKGLARRLYKALLELGPEAAQALAKTHRYRIPLRR
jgi:hypothetical protein